MIVITFTRRIIKTDLISGHLFFCSYLKQDISKCIGSACSGYVRIHPIQTYSRSRVKVFVAICVFIKVYFADESNFYLP